MATLAKLDDCEEKFPSQITQKYRKAQPSQLQRGIAIQCLAHRFLLIAGGLLAFFVPSSLGDISGLSIKGGAVRYNVIGYSGEYDGLYCIIQRFTEIQTNRISVKWNGPKSM